jgi:hypothetical protein
MKSEIVEKEKEELVFPCLMMSKESGSVYLMSSEKVGTCVHYGNVRGLELADHGNDLRIENMTPFKGKVILQND